MATNYANSHYHIVSNASDRVVYFENNIHDAPIPTIWDASSNTLSSSFDSNMNLTGTTAQSYLGLMGAEIKADVEQPNPPTLNQL